MRADWNDFAKIAAPSLKSGLVPAAQAPRQSVKATAPARVGGSPGAASTRWDPNYKPPEKYREADPRWSPGERAAWKKEIATMKARDLRFAALRKRYNGAPIPIEELRRAFNGK